MKETVLQ